jgi:2-oxoglutarate dehydrogenase E2 component (dihydrolipoamide succinyltransferase)
MILKNKVMANVEILMPKMGEGIIEATVTKWLKNVGDRVEQDEPVVEIATDKVDSEITSSVNGILNEILHNEGDVVPVGSVLAIIETGDNNDVVKEDNSEFESAVSEKTKDDKEEGAILQPDRVIAEFTAKEYEMIKGSGKEYDGMTKRFYSPLVRNIAKKEGITNSELDEMHGSGKGGRITKDDVFNYLNERNNRIKEDVQKKEGVKPQKFPTVDSPADEIIEMDRMRRLIADNMVNSLKISPHVTSFIDVDLTNIVNWRNEIKDDFYKREGVKLTYTPIFVEAVASALKEFPMVNASVDDYKIILHKRINIGMATALPNGNLIVPVIKDADTKSLLGLAKDVNDLANRARNNKLMPEEVMGGTFTITNFGSFDSLTGTPIINQPQVAILAVGAIRKKPVVLETDQGDVIAIRHIAIFSLAYDHRIVDGALGGMFLKKIKEILENKDIHNSNV